MNNNSKYVQQIEPNLSLSQKYENHIKIMNQIYIDKTEVKQNYARICEAYKNVAHIPKLNYKAQIYILLLYL